MKRFFVLSLLVLSGFCTSAQTGKAAADGDDAMRRMEVAMRTGQLRAAILDKDSVLLQSLLSEDVTYGHSNGWIQSKSGFIRSVMSREQDYKKMDVRKMEVRVFGNTAVVNLETDVSLIMTGKTMDLDMDILLVWVNAGGEWKLVARQSVKNS